jgi:hypothetical protein
MPLLYAKCYTQLHYLQKIKGKKFGFKCGKNIWLCCVCIDCISLTRSSIAKLRWCNLFGAASFCIYGLFTNAYPVAFLNGLFALTNLFFLKKRLVKTQQQFTILKVNRPSNYVDFFLDFHQMEIQHLFPRFMKVADFPDREYYFLAEVTNVVGMLSGYREAENTFVIDFDFVVSAYRDCRLGHFTLGHGQAVAKNLADSRIVALADSLEHQNYLSELGFSLKVNG